MIIHCTYMYMYGHVVSRIWHVGFALFILQVTSHSQSAKIAASFAWLSVVVKHSQQQLYSVRGRINLLCYSGSRVRTTAYIFPATWVTFQFVKATNQLGTAYIHVCTIDAWVFQGTAAGYMYISHVPQ